MTRLRLAIVLSVVSAAAITTLGVVLIHARRGSGTRLVGGGDKFSFCWSALNEAQWARLGREGMEFGLDAVSLSPPSGQVTVTKAELVNPAGGIRLLRAVFVPNAQVGIGAFGTHYGLPPYLADKVKELPATLTRTPKPAGASVFDEASWQLAVVVSAPMSATDASASGVKLTYLSGGTQHTVHAKDSVRVRRGACGHAG